MLRHILLLVMANALAWAQAPATPKPAASHPATYAISGRVVNAVDGQPLAKTEVLIRPSENQEQLQHTITDQDGYFRFDNLPKGKYGLSAKRHGFTEQSYRQHEYFSTAIAVGPELRSENLTFPLAPDAAISGTVTDEQNEAVPGGMVELFKSGVEGGIEAVRMQDQTAVDDQGHYHFGHLSPGKYYVVVSARPWFAAYAGPTVTASVVGDGSPEMPRVETESVSTIPPELDVAYPITYYSGATDADQAAAIDLQPGSRATADIQLNAVPAVHLRVRTPNANSNMQPNINFTQHVFDRFDANIQTSAMQVSPGVLAVSGLPPGRFVMNVSSFDGKDWTNRSQVVDLAGDVEINASETGSSPVVINGNIRVTGGEALPQQAYIRFYNREAGDAFGERVSPQGEFHIEHDVMKPGAYEVVVFNLPDHVVAGLSASGAKVIGHTLQLSGGESVRLSVLVSNGLGRIDGTALAGDKPTADGMVVLVPQDIEHDGALVRRDQSDSDGTFTLRDVVPGKYTVLAIEDGWNLQWANPTVLKPFLAHGETATVSGSGKYSVKVCLQSQSGGCK
jgi:hypothetical protein